jgi:anti-sigma regulatory factor (Ser/Thr protein kinase)
LDSTPSCVMLVRGMLAGLGETLGLDPELVDDLKTAVSEACNNVVLHAYPDRPGPLSVELDIDASEIDVTVRDRGTGIRNIAASEDRIGVGLAVISALADRAEFQSVADGGTAVRMAFTGRGANIALLDRAQGATGLARAEALALSGDVVATVCPAGLLPGVLGRLTRAAAAGAHFSLDRFSDLYLVADEVSAQASMAAAGAAVGFALTAGSGRLSVTIGPFPPGSGDRLRGDHAPGGGVFSFTRLVDELTLETRDDVEVWTLVVRDRRERESD